MQYAALRRQPLALNAAERYDPHVRGLWLQSNACLT